MPAYVISEVEILDASQGQRYRDLAAASIARHGGKYLVRGAAPDLVRLTRLRQTLAVRQTALTRRLVFVDGVDHDEMEATPCAHNMTAAMSDVPALGAGSLVVRGAAPLPARFPVPLSIRTCGCRDRS